MTGARVLVVEDEFYIADELVRALRNSGAEPIGPVSNLQDARRVISEKRPDAAILDLNLRGEIASTLAKELEADGVPCLIVSGYGDDSMPEAVSGVPRLEKPISSASVISSLEAQLGSPLSADTRGSSTT